jgi:hypothetical protein
MLLLLILLTLTAAQPVGEKVNFDRLTGSWLMQTPRMAFLEKWEKRGDLYLGAMFIIQEKDTTPAETIRLLAEGGSYYYEATTSGQNEGQAVKFKLVSYSPDRWVFENPAHDYPQRIVYAFVGQDSLVASISAITGPEKLTYFRFKRVN